MKVGGNAWGEINYSQPYAKLGSPLGTRMNLGISLDARTNSEFGLVRTFVNNQVSYRMGSEASGSANNEGLTFRGANTESTKETQMNVVGFVQVGGLTVGHMTSMYQVTTPSSNIGLSGFHNPDLSNVVGYTFALGNGFTITAALEDSTVTNRNGVWSGNNSGAYKATVAPVFNNDGSLKTAGTSSNGTAITQGGNRLPDYVGNIAIAQSWGTVALSGAVHTINTSYNAVGTEYGYAGQLAGKINLPMLAKGSYLYLSGAMSSGANAFTMRNEAGDRTSQNTNGFGIGRVAVSMNDIAINTDTNQVYKAKGTGLTAEVGHYFTPTVMAHLGVSYVKIDWDVDARAMSTTQLNPADIQRVNFGVQWTPVKGLRIWPDVEYSKIKTNVATANGLSAAAGPGDQTAKRSESNWTGRLQIRRDF